MLSCKICFKHEATRDGVCEVCHVDDRRDRQGRHAWLDHLDDEPDETVMSDALDASIRGLPW